MTIRPSNIRLALFLLAAWLTLTPRPAEAQSCDGTKPVATAAEGVTQVRALNRAGCLGGPACDSPICRRLKPLLDGAPNRQQISDALRAVLEEARTVAEIGRDRESLLAQMGLSLAQFVDNRVAAAAAWTLEGLALFADEPHEIDLESRLENCSDSASCTLMSAHAQRVIELATLFRRTLVKADEGIRGAFSKQLELLDKRWRAYLGSSRGQYPWELAVNSALYRKTAQFDAPPTSQWIFAHPGAAFELSRSSNDRQPSESLLLEVAGLYRWSWKEEKMRQRWGGSVTMAWRDAGEGRQKLGYGALAYLPRASTIGYVWRPQDGNDEHSVVLSADIVKFLRGTDGIRERFMGASDSK